MFYFLAWVLMAALVGKYSSTLGRSFFGWFILSLLISPFLGFLIALIVGKKKE